MPQLAVIVVGEVVPAAGTAYCAMAWWAAVTTIWRKRVGTVWIKVPWGLIGHGVSPSYDKYVRPCK